MLPYVATTALCLALLLRADARDRRASMGLFKLVASALFVTAAFRFGALEHAHGQAIFVGFLLSFLGDALLISRKESVFLAGIGAFLAAHVAFVVGFLHLPVAAPSALAGGLGMAVFSGFVWGWLSPHLPRGMRLPVLAYVVTIGTMVSVAVGAYSGGASSFLLGGAVIFCVSDLFVARERFVASSLWNRALGLPLYYGAQLLLVVAATTAGG